MSESTQGKPAVTPEITTAPAGSGWSRIPDHLGRARTSTLVLVVLFLAIGTLYLNIRPATTVPASTSTGTEVPAGTTAPAPEPTATPSTSAPDTTSEQPTPTTEVPTTSTVPTDTTTPGTATSSATSTPTGATTSVPLAPATTPGG